jgi:hypothetical protein
MMLRKQDSPVESQQSSQRNPAFLVLLKALLHELVLEQVAVREVILRPKSHQLFASIRDDKEPNLNLLDHRCLSGSIQFNWVGCLLGYSGAILELDFGAFG